MQEKMDETHHRRLLFGTTTHRRTTASSGPSTGEAPSGIAYGEACEREMIEKSNDVKMDNLRGHVGEMRHLALNIGEEVRDQNAMLEGMTGTFDQAGDSVRHTIALIRQLASNGNGLHICILFLFAFVFFILIYLLLR